MNKSTPCGNSRTFGCEGVVTKRGHILCDKCIQNRTSAVRSKRDQDDRALLQRVNTLEQQLENAKSQFQENREEYEKVIDQLEQHKLELFSEVEKLEREYHEKLEKLKLEKDRIVDNHKREIKRIETQYEENIKKLELQNQVLVLKNDELKILTKETMDEKDAEDKLNTVLTNANSKWKEENQELHKQLDDIEKEMDNLGQENTDLLNQVGQLKCDIESLTIENEKIQRRNYELNFANDELVAKLQSQSNELANSLQRRHSERTERHRAVSKRNVIPQMKKRHSKSVKNYSPNPVIRGRGERALEENKNSTVNDFKNVVEDGLPRDTTRENIRRKKG